MRLLIIDDEEDICDLIAEIAARHDLETRTISDAENVSGVLSNFIPDIIMMDLMMPGIDGVELLRLLSEKAKQAKLCLISGSDTRVLNSARRLGSAHGLDVIAALEKPLGIQTLNDFFKQAVSTARPPEGDNHGHALANGQFMLYYQPIVDLKTRAIKGVEALARWQHPERGVLMPDKFLDKITNGGLMQALTDFVIASAIKQAGVWDKAGHKLTLSINVSASSLLDLSMPDKIADMCNKYNVPHERLILEVTETEAMRDVTRTMDVLLRMRLRNIGISIDDFGTGHSSLRELQRMPFSELKIDRNFISDSTKSTDAAVIVASMIDLGHNLGLRIIAEGIEDQATWDLMRDKGCDYAQGFFIGHPMRAEDLAVWIEKWRAQS